MVKTEGVCYLKVPFTLHLVSFNPGREPARLHGRGGVEGVKVAIYADLEKGDYSGLSGRVQGPYKWKRNAGGGGLERGLAVEEWHEWPPEAGKGK